MLLVELQSIAQAQPYPLLFATVSGAHLYGFPSPDSDYDLRGVHILPLPEVVGLNIGEETIEQSQLEANLELDLVTHDVKKFMSLMLKKNGYVLEQLFSPLIVQTTPAHNELKAIAPRCITRHHSHHYLGFAQTQWRLFEKEQPPRVKPLLYVYRVLLTGIHLMQTGAIEANLVTLNQQFHLSQISDLIERKLQGGERSKLTTTDRTFHQQEYHRLVQILVEESDRTYLPEAATAQAELHDLLVRIRLASV
ncbi:nucleotidyltransferase domain-containing protein [Microcoleus sp. FACHB-1515]|uniref:nucleotidyltransferase domain-containing protein n=1 Tax=Cyanophyceae TaxID=3028117 RepID=UPI001685B435|nr:nucleotidyltransferase domain-containing protein [Microcoleus sp. FACHB-1515]MBD2090970.1 nucleotidyltransferase domain-containing protein [Microcoleus sp. FACHB-1515]